MKLPAEEQNVLNEIIKAKGVPLRAATIADTLGIQDNHCIKLIKYLTDKGRLNKDQRRYVIIGGKKQSYKEYWIEEKEPDPIQELIEKCHEQRITYPEGHREKREILIQIGKLNEQRRKKGV